MNTMSNTLSVEISSSDTSTSRPDRMLGMTTETSVRSREAPSIVAESISSRSSVVLNDDCVMITAKPRYCQMKIRISQIVAESGLVVKRNDWLTPNSLRIVFRTPRSSYIHDQIVPVTIKDMAIGYKIRVRMYDSALGKGVSS